jgi:hypothetical protein
MVKAKKPKGEELRKRTLNLTCQLTDEELAERLDSLVDWENNRSESELGLARWLGEIKEQKKVYEGEVSTAAAKCERLARVIRDKEEYRDVEVVDLIDGSTVTTVRTDTGTIVGERPATDMELQKKLDLGGGKEEARPKTACTCNPEKEGVHEIDCPIHGVMGDE